MFDLQGIFVLIFATITQSQGTFHHLRKLYGDIESVFDIFGKGGGRHHDHHHHHHSSRQRHKGHHYGPPYGGHHHNPYQVLIPYAPFHTTYQPGYHLGFENFGLGFSDFEHDIDKYNYHGYSEHEFF